MPCLMQTTSSIQIRGNDQWVSSISISRIPLVFSGLVIIEYNMRDDGFSIASLHMWARMDNLEEYDRIISEAKQMNRIAAAPAMQCIAYHDFAAHYQAMMSIL